MRGANGQPLGRFCLNSGYLEAMKQIVAEQLAYGIDGFHIRGELFTLLAHGAFVTMVEKTGFDGWPFLVEGPATVYAATTARSLGELLKPYRTTRQLQGKDQGKTGTSWPMSAEAQVGPALLLNLRAP
jgi:hypothetical protein